MNEDGSMARLPELIAISKKFDLRIISIKDLVAYRINTETLIKKEVEVSMPTKYGDFILTAYTQTTTGKRTFGFEKRYMDRRRTRFS